MSDPLEKLQRGTNGFFPPIQVGDLLVSVQASEKHYCSPRLDLKNMCDYDMVEVAIFYDDDNYLTDPRADDKLKCFEWVKLFQHDQQPVAAFVPLKTVTKIINDIRSVSNMFS